MNSMAGWSPTAARGYTFRLSRMFFAAASMPLSRYPRMKFHTPKVRERTT